MGSCAEAMTTLAPPSLVVAADRRHRHVVHNARRVRARVARKGRIEREAAQRKRAQSGVRAARRQRRIRAAFLVHAVGAGVGGAEADAVARGDADKIRGVVGEPGDGVLVTGVAGVAAFVVGEVEGGKPESAGVVAELRGVRVHANRVVGDVAAAGVCGLVPSYGDGAVAGGRRRHRRVGLEVVVGDGEGWRRGVVKGVRAGGSRLAHNRRHAVRVGVVFLQRVVVNVVRNRADALAGENGDDGVVRGNRRRRRRSAQPRRLLRAPALPNRPSAPAWRWR